MTDKQAPAPDNPPMRFDIEPVARSLKRFSSGNPGTYLKGRHSKKAKEDPEG